MAIFPLLYSSVINLDVIATSTFQAGMALIRDNNNRAVKADSQQLLTLTSAQKYAKFIGFASSDHDVNNNTIITPDVIGSGFVDVISSRLAYQKDTEFSSPKRALMDLQDETVSKYFNPSDTTNIGKRGIGIYNQVNDVFITDQFVRVLHGDYGLDSTTLVDLNPGDLLTFGGGVNAGKLVKVNTDSFGPDVLVIGVVEKYISSTNLLHFRQANYSLSFGVNSQTLYYDFGNPASYTSGTTVYDLTLNGKNGTLLNGPVYTNLGVSSYLTFDGGDDVIETSTNATGFGMYDSEYTLVAVVNMASSSRDQFIFGNNSTVSRTGLHVGFIQSANILYPTLRHWGADLTYFSLSLTSNQTYYAVWRFTPSASTFFQNGSFYTMGTQSSYLGTNNIGISRNATSGSGAFQGRIYSIKIFNRGLTNAEITKMYNFEKSRYGL